MVSSLRNEKNSQKYLLEGFAGSKEFFIQKAIGWALREYSKTDGNGVRKFIQSNSLAPLSVREGMRLIQ